MISSGKTSRITCNNYNDVGGTVSAGEQVIFRVRNVANLKETTISGKVDFVAQTLNATRSNFIINGNSQIIAKKLNLDGDTEISGDGNLKIATESETLRGIIDISGKLIVEAFNPNAKIELHVLAEEFQLNHAGKCEFKGSTSAPMSKKLISNSFDQTYQIDQ